MFDSSDEGKPDEISWIPPDPELLTRCFEDYSVVSLVLQEDASAIYRGIQLSLERPVMVRLLAPPGSADPNWRERIREEVRVTSALEHPGITTIHDFGSIEIPGGDECFFLVTEWIDGDTLSDRIHSGRMPLEAALPVAVQICDAIEYAHDRDYVHRRIRPENVFVSPCGRVKLGNFELADRIEEFPPGTAPEVRNGRDFDHRADVYSLGATICEMLTGTAPGESGWVPSPGTRLDPDLGKVVRKAMEEDPDCRYTEVSEIRTECEKILETLPRRRRKRNRILAVATIPGVAAVVAAFALWQPESRPWRPPPISVEADLLVTTDRDGDGISGSLREAIARAEPGDVIGFDESLAGRAILIDPDVGGLVIEKSITIDAGNLDEAVILDGNDKVQVMKTEEGHVIRLAHLVITGGNGRLEGSGIRNLGADLTIENCAIVDNRTRALRGGGIFSLGTMTLRNCLIAENVSEQGGSGICNFGGQTMTLENCTITGNECVKKSRYGCAVLNVNFSTMTMIHCTVVANREVGVHSHDASNLFIENSIFADNKGFGTDDIYIRKRGGSGVETRGVNLVGILDADMKSGDLPIGGSPMLSPLGDYGGWTATMRPLPGSPVIDRGPGVASGPSTDARGHPRPVDGDRDGVSRSDLGAVELDPRRWDR